MKNHLLWEGIVNRDYRISSEKRKGKKLTCRKGKVKQTRQSNKNKNEDFNRRSKDNVNWENKSMLRKGTMSDKRLKEK